MKVSKANKRKPGRPKRLKLAGPRQIRFEKDTDSYLNSLDNVNEFVRKAVAEKIERLNQQEEGIKDKTEPTIE